MSDYPDNLINRASLVSVSSDNRRCTTFLISEVWALNSPQSNK